MPKNKQSSKLILICLSILVLSVFFSSRLSMADNSIGPDDALRITVFGYNDLTTETRVTAEGRISFPLIGEIAAKGKSSIELEQAIAARLKQGGFIQDAQVTVAVLEHLSQLVSVLGNVKNPGRYSLESSNSILDMIAQAGGINEFGDTKLTVTRTVGGKAEKQEVDIRDYLETNEYIPFKLQKGDVIYVPKAPMFYIYGEVQHPGGYRLEPNFSIVKALSVGGGLTLRGSQSSIEIKRKDAKGVLQEIEAELNDPVMTEDVIYVGERWF